MNSHLINMITAVLSVIGIIVVIGACVAGIFSLKQTVAIATLFTAAIFFAINLERN